MLAAKEFAGVDNISLSSKAGDDDVDVEASHMEWNSVPGSRGVGGMKGPGAPPIDVLLSELTIGFEVDSKGVLVVPGEEWESLLREREHQFAMKFTGGDERKLRVDSIRAWLGREVAAIVDLCCPKEGGGLSFLWNRDLRTVFGQDEQIRTLMICRFLKLGKEWKCKGRICIDVDHDRDSLEEFAARLKSTLILREMVEGEAPFAILIMSFLPDIRIKFFEHDFFLAVFSLMRMAGREGESDLQLRRLRRSFADRLESLDSLNPRFSLFRRFLLLFGSGCQVSESIFATTFARCIFGSENCLEWKFADKRDCELNLYGGSIRTIRRWVKCDQFEDFEIEFCGDHSYEGSRSLRTVIRNVKTKWERVFFNCLSYGGVRSAKAETDEYERKVKWWRRINKEYAGKPWLEHTRLKSTSLENCFVDFGKILIHVLLEALNVSPCVLFLMDACSHRSFRILTEEVPDAIFPTPTSPGEYLRAYSENPVRFVEVVLFQLLLGLEDLGARDFCSVDRGKSSDVRIIDFRMPKPFPGKMEIPEAGTRFCIWIESSPLLCGKGIRIGVLRSAFAQVKQRLESLPSSFERLFVYPCPKDSIPLIECLCGTVAQSESADVSFADFLEDSVRGILKFFFVERLDEKEAFQDRCLAELFGFVATKEEFEELRGLLSGDWEESSLRQWIRDKERCRKEDCMSVISAISQLLSLKDLLLSRLNRFDSMMTQFLESRCSDEGTEFLLPMPSVSTFGAVILGLT
jgi:hypothetical protein